ncbi:hypothetical protein C8J55DRAFT_485219 [Lentinula edodes]|uniref:Uncharacterized protein n=1 Tax=Lentinula lateritia TaxID=40482 RepID=A0A9W9AZ20_9AGAR|nr:hypothetical protein C8J55DRAFT_485219 [Lentinula edodes]
MFSSVSSFVASKASGDKSASLPTTPLLISTLSSNISSDGVEASGGHLHQTKVWADVEMYSGNYISRDAKDKTISPLLSGAENFQLYCDEKFQTRTGKEELECQFCGMSEEDISALVEQIGQRKVEKLARIEKFKNIYRRRPAEEEEDSDEDTDKEDELKRCTVM